MNISSITPYTKPNATSFQGLKFLDVFKKKKENPAFKNQTQTATQSVYSGGFNLTPIPPTIIEDVVSANPSIADLALKTKINPNDTDAVKEQKVLLINWYINFGNNATKKVLEDGSFVVSNSSEMGRASITYDKNGKPNSIIDNWCNIRGNTYYSYQTNFDYHNDNETSISAIYKRSERGFAGALSSINEEIRVFDLNGKIVYSSKGNEKGIEDTSDEKETKSRVLRTIVEQSRMSNKYLI